jgi:glycogen phosphorylase
VKIESDGTDHLFDVQVFLHDLDPAAVRVELYADGLNGDGGVRCEMARVGRLEGADGGCAYRTRVPATRPATDYTARIVPSHADMAVPLETALIVWQR